MKLLPQITLLSAVLFGLAGCTTHHFGYYDPNMGVVCGAGYDAYGCGTSNWFPDGQCCGCGYYKPGFWGWFKDQCRRYRLKNYQHSQYLLGRNPCGGCGTCPNCGMYPPQMVPPQSVMPYEVHGSVMGTVPEGQRIESIPGDAAPPSQPAPQLSDPQDMMPAPPPLNEPPVQPGPSAGAFPMYRPANGYSVPSHW